MKMKLKNKYHYTPEPGEVNSGEQLTIPNEGLSLKDLLYKHTIDYQGYQREGSFNEDPDHDDLDIVQTANSDFTEIDEIKNSNKEKIKQKQETVNFFKKKKEQTQNPSPLPATD